MGEQIKEEPKEDQPLEVLKLNVEFELKTGIVRVGGHISNTDICMKVLIEAAHIILVKNSEKDKASIEAQQKVLNAAKLNGLHENAPPTEVI